MKTSESTHLEDRSFVIKYWVQVNQAWRDDVISRTNHYTVNRKLQNVFVSFYGLSTELVGISAFWDRLPGNACTV